MPQGSARTLDVRVGIRVGGRRSRCWRVRSGANTPELFIEREGLEKAVHVSLHESGRWHLKALGKNVHEWLQPDEMHPGYTRAVVIVQPPGVASLTMPAVASALLFDLSAEMDDAAQFNVFLEQPGANQDTWPGQRSMGTEFVARLPLARGAGTCCIVLHRAPIEAGRATFPRPGNNVLSTMLESALRGELYATLVGSESDGAVALIDGRLAETAGVLRDEMPGV